MTIQAPFAERSRHPHARIIAAVFVIALAAYCRTAYPTITWWDSSSYSLVSATLGVASPPGSLLLTLIGWLVTRVNLGLAPAHLLNLLAASFGALTAAGLYVVSLRALRRGSHLAVSDAAAWGIGFGALTYAFCDTPWEYAVKFTPYILTTVFTAAILWTLIRWWDEADRDDAWRWLALLSLLFGLDFSVHRTNAMLMPGAIAWVLIRRPGLAATPRALLACIGGMAAGLSVQFLIIPIAIHTSSPWRSDAPVTLASFWRYISVARMGGGFLLQFFPRKSPLLSGQTADFIRIVAGNFYSHTIAGALPAILGAIGVVALWRRERRFAVALSRDSIRRCRSR